MVIEYKREMCISCGEFKDEIDTAYWGKQYCICSYCVKKVTELVDQKKRELLNKHNERKDSFPIKPKYINLCDTGLRISASRMTQFYIRNLPKGLQKTAREQRSDWLEDVRDNTISYS